MHHPIIASILAIASFIALSVGLATLFGFGIKGPWHTYMENHSNRIELRGFWPWQIALVARRVERMHKQFDFEINHSSLLRRRGWTCMATMRSRGNVPLRGVRWECMRDFILALYQTNFDGGVRIYLDGTVAADFICMNDFLANHRVLKDQLEFDRLVSGSWLMPGGTYHHINVGSATTITAATTAGTTLSGITITTAGTTLSGITITGGTP